MPSPFFEGGKQTLGDQIGEFRGKNTGYRVLPDGKIESSSQGTGKLLGIDAFILSTAVGVMRKGLFVGEVYSVITTMDGDAVTLKGNAVGWPTGSGGSTRSATTQTTSAQKLMKLNKILGLHEYETDREDNWVGKIWEWK